MIWPLSPTVKQSQAATSEDAGWAPELIYKRIHFDNEIPIMVLKDRNLVIT
jgi:hypothetical protein